MRYVNKETGTVIETECTIKGGLWEPVKIAPAQPRKAEAEPEPEEKPAAKKRGGKK